MELVTTIVQGNKKPLNCANKFSRLFLFFASVFICSFPLIGFVGISIIICFALSCAFVLALDLLFFLALNCSFFLFVI